MNSESKQTDTADGGPAFLSVLYKQEPTENWSSDGMSLRDWFAGQALTGIHASRETFLAILADRGRQDPLQAVARAAYSMADEMLAARAESKAS